MDVAQAVQAESRSGRAAARSEGLDPWGLGLWAIAVVVAAMALPAANWTDRLGFVPVAAMAGVALGLLLVVSHFGGRTAFFLALGYGVALVLWQLTSTLDPGLAWRERVLDVGRRVIAFISLVAAGEPSQDSLMFVLAMVLTFWGMAVFGTWWLFRRGGLWLAVLLPGVAVFLNVYYYRYGERLQIYMPVFLLVVLALIVRTELNRRRMDWAERQAQVSTDVAARVTQAGIVAAALLIVAAWLGPQVPDGQTESPTGVTGARSPFDDFLADALAGLRAPVNLYGETYASTLALGAGRPPGDRVVFEARSTSDVPEGARVYWRARAYDTYRDGTWEVTLGDPIDYRPRDGVASPTSYAGRVDFEYAVVSFLPAMRLLFLPAEAVEVNRSAELLELAHAGAVVDVLEGRSVETLLPGDSYRGRSRLAAPSAEDLQSAGTEYPEWVTSWYLERPDDLPRSVTRLAAEAAAGKSTPYDKAEAITAWLRANMNYERQVAAPPEGRDPVDWFLSESRLGFCDYYASAAVLMLRSLGVPSRLAAGYATGQHDAEHGTYVVSEADLHSWPEVYFPGYGWVEFEPTVSQPPLERVASPIGAGAPAGAADGAASDLGSAGPAGLDRLAQLADIEEVTVPEAVAPARPWLAAAAAALVLLGAAVYLTPARRVVARWLVAGAERSGRVPPARIEEWAMPPATEVTRIYRKLAAWPARLGIRLEQDATPVERGQAIADVLPEFGPEIDRIVDGYGAERYGDVSQPAGEAVRAWKAVRLPLYRAGLTRLLDLIFARNDN